MSDKTPTPRKKQRQRASHLFPGEGPGEGWTLSETVMNYTIWAYEKERTKAFGQDIGVCVCACVSVNCPLALVHWESIPNP